jgi:hypothetical protein
MASIIHDGYIPSGYQLRYRKVESNAPDSHIAEDDMDRSRHSWRRSWLGSMGSEKIVHCYEYCARTGDMLPTIPRCEKYVRSRIQ